MITEHVKNFIVELIKKTESGKLKWKVIDKLDTWELIKRQIEKEIDLKDYFINDAKSYGMNKSGGYVILLNVQYGNAPIFSPVLDKYILFIKINDDFLPQSLSDYDEQGYKDLLLELIEAIETKENEAYNIPDCMYSFFEKILEEDENGRTINE